MQIIWPYVYCRVALARSLTTSLVELGDGRRIRAETDGLTNPRLGFVRLFKHTGRRTHIDDGGFRLSVTAQNVERRPVLRLNNGMVTAVF